MKKYLSLIKFSHTIFALPFAMVGFFLAIYSENKNIDWSLLVKVLLCMVFARSAAMAFNRYLDKDIDAQNPRTAVREIPAGAIKPQSALLFVIINIVLFVATTWLINPLCFFLSPVALLVILGYSYTKRFTFLCHFVLGLGLSLAPIGAYIAVTGRFDLLPVLYSLIVLLWVSGFDIIYALQDEEFDKSMLLNSVPVFLGKRRALILSNVLHVICAVVLLIVLKLLLNGFYPAYRTPSGEEVASALSNIKFGWIHGVGVMIFIGLLFYQHTLVNENDLSKVNMAFFTTNGIASVIYGTLFIIDVLV